MVLAAVDGVEWNPGQVESSEHVRVAELGGEGDTEEVERRDRPVRVDGELADPVLAHERLEIRPDRVCSLGQDAITFVQDLVEDLDALVGQADLVRIRIHERPPDSFVVGAPVLDGRVELAAHVLDRLLHPRQQRFQAREQRLDGHAREAPNQNRTRVEFRLSVVVLPPEVTVAPT
jgi:hypothetical protein